MKLETNYDSFVLPFVSEATDEKMPDGRYERLEYMQEKVLPECIFIGELNTGIDGPPGMSWLVEDYYYLMPWKGGDYDWALFRISWNDNWGRFEWDACGRIAGVTGAREAARLIFKGLIKKWGYDLRRKEYSVHRGFLEEI
jgi:hypothetical protein